jgi:hypothetical protein
VSQPEVSNKRSIIIVIIILTQFSVGCVENGSSYEVGKEVKVGCDKLCRCLSNGSMSCSPRCMSPLVPYVGATAMENCTLIPDGSDSCCASIVCTHSNASSASPRK